ncbi:hypothetical protein ACFLU6_13140 [Acidobacteriota bacterium]
MSRPGVISFLIITLLFSVVLAEWSPDPAINTPICDASDPQVECKIVSAADGSSYISWFDSASDYDIQLQLMDARGNEQWAHNGITAADRNLSWVQDYGLDVDGLGRAVLAYRDESGGETLILAQLIAADGTLLWGSGGVLADMSATSFLAAPETAATTDGHYVVAWSRDSDTVLQKYDSSGAAVWPAEVVLSNPGVETFSVSDIKASDNGGVIVSLISEVFLAYRHLYAQKLDSDGNLVWGPSHVAVFDSGSLQMGNFPEFAVDGNGGAVFAWYEAASYLQSYVQHIRSDGTEAFPHNGVALSIHPSQERVSPSAVYNQATGEVFAFWVEESMGESQRGVYGQKISDTGTREWSDYGIVVEPVDATLSSYVSAMPYGDGAYVFYLESLTGNEDHILGARLDSSGAIVCTAEVSIAAFNKGDLQVALGANGMALLAWADGRNSDSDIYGQNINPDCTPGIIASEVILYRSTVADLSPGWKSSALPLTSSNDDETNPPFPITSSLGSTETDAIVTSDPLILYRVLGPGDVSCGNILRAVKTALGVELTF